MAYIFDLSDAWAASGTTFTGIKLNVTDTASAAGSLLMDLQVGGASRMRVTKGGNLLIGSDLTSASSVGRLYLFKNPVNNNDVFLYNNGEVQVRFSVQGADRANITGNNFVLRSDGALGFSSTTDVGIAVDVSLFRDAANTLAQRNGVNAQAFNLYNTYTDASNYERGFMSWSHTANRLVVGTGALGTGTNRSIQLGAGNGSVSLITSSTGRVDAYANEFTINNTGGTERLRVDAVGSVRIATGLTVATLPSTPLVGMMARVTDATTPTVGSTVTGGGAAAALCWYNGTNWTVIGV